MGKYYWNHAQIKITYLTLHALIATNAKICNYVSVAVVHLVRVYPYPFWVYPAFSYPNTHTHTHTHIFKIPIPIPIPTPHIPKMGMKLTVKHISNSIKETIERLSVRACLAVSPQFSSSGA